MRSIIYLLGSFCLLYLSSCSKKEKFAPDKETHFIDEDFILVEKDCYDGNEYTFLIKSTSEPEYFFKWTEYSSGVKRISAEKYYSTGIGDTLHFEFIRRDKFFRCKNIKLNYNGEIRQRRDN